MIVAALFATNAFATGNFATEIPKRAQKKILAVATEIDLNRDGNRQPASITSTEA
jgi:hypothetical protein